MFHLRKDVPTYRQHKTKNLAYVRIGGQMIYLGKFGSVESKKKYARIIAEWAASGGDAPLRISDLTIADLFAAFWSFAKARYRKNGKATKELANYKAIGQILLDLYGDTRIEDFSTRQFKACREVMLGLGWTRDNINRQASRLRSIFRWGVAEDMVQPELIARLKAVAGLWEGYEGVAESSPVEPVDRKRVRAIWPELSPIERGMVLVQSLTGMRSSELVAMRPEMIDQSGPVWIYDAPSKTKHLGYDRPVMLGRRARRILKLFLLRCEPGEYLFRPEEMDAWRRAKRHAARKTPLSCGNRPGKSNRPRKRKKIFSECFTSDTYRQALRRACDRVAATRWAELHFGQQPDKNSNEWKTFVQPFRWHPHQLRHSVGQAVWRDFGAESAKAYLGHKSIKMTEHYAGQDMELAKRVAEAVG